MHLALTHLLAVRIAFAASLAGLALPTGCGKQTTPPPQEVHIEGYLGDSRGVENVWAEVCPTPWNDWPEFTSTPRDSDARRCDLIKSGTVVRLMSADIPECGRYPESRCSLIEYDDENGRRKRGYLDASSIRRP
jgi:hypothetical protein